MPEPGDREVLGGAAPALASAALALARRFGDGATLWCWSPGSPQDAEHVAVEFVHPVVVGTRALPAVAVSGTGGEGRLRTLARSGDALLAIGPPVGPMPALLARARAWGLTTLWLGSGERPRPGAADHVLWLGPDPHAGRDGRLVLGYHVLWELTHVCFEHPGLLDVPVEDGAVCVTCADEGRLGEVVASLGDEATVRTATGLERVSTVLVGPVDAGDLVLVHAGTAITTVEP
jgi:hypothetical protein